MPPQKPSLVPKVFIFRESEDHFANMSREVLDDESIAPLERIRRILDIFIDFFRSKDFTLGCPVGNLAQEMGDINPVFRDKLQSAIYSMVQIYSKVLKEAQERGELSPLLNIEETAYFLVTSWHGALVHMKTKKGPEPLENHKKFIFGCVLRP